MSVRIGQKIHRIVTPGAYGRCGADGTFRARLPSRQKGSPLRMRRQPALAFLLLTLVVEVAFALVLRAPAVDDFFGGNRDSGTLLRVVALCWIPVQAVAVVGVWRALRSARQREARGSDQVLADVASASHDWVWAADRDLRVTYSNARVTELLGYTQQEVQGRTLLRYLMSDSAARLYEVLQQALGSGRGWEDLELDWVDRDGRVVRLQGVAVPVRDSAGMIVGFRGVRRLVTSAMENERSLAAASQRIRETVQTGAVDIALQPIVSLTTGRVAGVEALARFRDGRGPDQWFREARETGLALELDQLTFRAALELLPSLPDDVYLSVNASPGLILDPALNRMLLSGDVPLERVVLEVTEHVEIARYDDVHEALAPLRERGLRVAVDDTGAGYASLTHVLQLRPDLIKLDRSLIADVSTDPARRSLITALILLSLDLGATVTAEGVETEMELETLMSLGLDNVQGYLLARPTTEAPSWQSWWTRNWLSQGASTLS